MKFKPKKRTSNRVDPFKSFIRITHSTRNLRAGIGKARLQAESASIPRIVHELSTSPLYRVLVTSEAFPSTLSLFNTEIYLPESSLQTEFLWTSSVLSLFNTELSKFVVLQSLFVRHFLNGSLTKAKTILDEIEGHFGSSIWLIERRLQILQLSDGLQAQKTYLEEIISTPGLSRLVTFISYMLSFRAEESVSLAGLTAQLDCFQAHPLYDYILFHINPYDLTKIENISSVLAREEPHPILDRFQTLLAMAELHIARHGLSASSFVLQGLKLLEETGESRISRLIRLERPKPASDLDLEIVKAVDTYTEGRYKDVDLNNHECIDFKRDVRCF